MNKRLSKRLLPLMLSSLFAMSGAYAQNTSSSLSGRILDSNGMPVAGATVEIVHIPSGTTRTVVTDAEGRYSAQGLRVGGPFELRASTDSGVAADQGDVYLRLSQETTLDLVVSSEGAPTLEGITVTADAAGAIFQPSNMGLSTNISQRELEVLPNPGRSIQDIARLDPNINITNKGRGEISALGQNSRYNNITIDGVATNDVFGLEANGLPALNQPISYDAVEEYNLSTANLDVTNKRAVGANINIVTKSGTNEFHGNAYYAYTNAKDLTSDEPSEFSGYSAKKIFGATLGGPIVKDKLFFFLSYEENEVLAPAPDYGPLGSGASNEVDITQDELNQIIDIANGYGLTPGNLEASDANQVSKLYLAKLDWNISDQHRASFRYNKTKSDQPVLGGFNSRTLSLSSYWYTQSRDFESYVLNLYSDWTDTFSTEGSFSYSNYNSTPTVIAQQPQINVRLGPDNSNVGVNLGEEQFRHYNVLDVDTYSGFFAGNWYLGDHTIKAGADFQRDEIFNLFGRTQFGAYNFASIDDFAAGDFSGFTLYLPSNGDINSIAAAYRLDQWGLFVQDTWQVTPNFSLQYGLRYDIPLVSGKPVYNASFEEAFGYSNQGTVNGNGVIEPRVSFNYNFETERLTQLRGGFGITEGVTPGVWLGNPYTNNGLTLDTYFCGPGSGFNPDPFTQQPPSNCGASGGQQTVDVVDPDFNLPTAMKFSLGFDRELPWWDLVGTIEFAYVDVENAIRYEAINLGPGNGLLPDGRINYWGNNSPDLWIGSNGNPVGANNPSGYTSNQRFGANPEFSGASTLLTNTSNGKAQYLTLSLQKSYSDTWFGSASLTFGRATEVNPGTSSQAYSNFQNNATFNPNEDIAERSNYDIEARFLTALTWQHRFFGDYVTSISGVFNGYTGQPYSWTFNNDANGDGISGNDLFYVPLDQNDVLYTPGTTQAQIDTFFAAIDGNEDLSDHRGDVVKRNANSSPWINQLDMSFRQEIPGFFEGNKGEIRFDIFNVGNLLNKNWGQIYSAPFNNRTGGYRQSLANFAGVDPNTGKYVYNLITPTDLPLQDNQAESRWSVLVTVRYTF
ncbi:carboxypeptidase regulatory-like domain-containing protein [Dokdonella sp.]|uniref:TonB-dependent receptor n=1 Tax=Dokdonella sp. TaxID=2291710 RepID=UPI003529156A